jgi:hypothetical protein
MKRLVLLSIAALCLYAGFNPAPESIEARRPRPLRPTPPPAPPKPKPSPSSDDYIGGATHDGRTVTIDLPRDQRLKNTVGTDRSGLCVGTSIEHSARWQYVPELIGLQKFLTQFPGGGWPQRVDDFLTQKVKAAHGNMADVQYIQITTFDEKKLDLALRTGRMPAITYGYSPRYGEPVSHMVNIVYKDDKYCVFLDNNFPDTYEWTSLSEGLRRIKLRLLDSAGHTDNNGGWFIVLLATAPPPDPKD